MRQPALTSIITIIISYFYYYYYYCVCIFRGLLFLQDPVHLVFIAQKVSK